MAAWAIARLDGWLRGMGLDPVCYRALVRAALLRDFRNQQFGRMTASGNKAVVAPLFWVLGQNLIIGLIAAGVLFARVDAFFFALVGLGVSMMVTISSIIVEYHEVVIDPDDLEILGHQPIPLRTYAAARVTNLAAWVLLTIASCALFPAVVGLGLRDADWTFLPWFSAAALVGNLAAAAAVILVYAAVLGSSPSEQARETLAWVQVVLIMVLFYGGQMVLRDPQQKLPMLAYDLPGWVHYTPLAWLAMLVLPNDPLAAQWRWPILLGGTLLTVGLWAAVVWRLSQVYARLQPGGSTWGRTTLRPLPAPGQLCGAIVRRLTRPGEERAGYWLGATMLRRDANLRMRCWPQLAVVPAALVTGWFTGQLADPLICREATCMLTLVGIYLVAAPLPILLHNLRFSRDHEAAWVLAAAPLADRAAFARGLAKAVRHRLLAPLLLAAAVGLAVLWRDPLHAALHAAGGWLAVLGLSDFCAASLLRGLPFSAPLARGQSFGPIAPMAAAVGGAAMLLAAVHFVAAASMAGLLAYLAGLAIVVAVARYGPLAWPTRPGVGEAAQ